MSDQARITSIEALEAFRADLLQYIRHAGSALEDMVGEVRRTRSWLDHDRVRYWATELKQRQKRLEQAEQELYSASLTNRDGAHAQLKLAVQRAERQVTDAEERIRVLKRWRLQFDQRAEPLVRQLDRMFAQLGHQLPKGVHSLGESIKALQDYAETHRPPAAGSGSLPSPAATPDSDSIPPIAL